MLKYTTHKIADLFPSMTDDELKSLAADIKANGLQVPVVLWNNEIIDGRHRYKACQMAGVKPDFVHWYPSVGSTTAQATTEAIRYVASLNLHRRHIPPSQLSVVAVNIAEFSHGGGRSGDENFARMSLENAAISVGVSPSLAHKASALKTKVVPEVYDLVGDGSVTVGDGLAIANLDPVTQKEAAEMVSSGKAPTLKKAVAKLSSESACKPSGEVNHGAEQRRHAQSSAIESFCREIGDFFKSKCPRDPWLDDGQFTIAQNQFNASMATLRLVKGHSVCHHCNGENCKKCRNTGFLTKRLSMPK